MYRANLFTLLRQESVQRTWKSAVVVTGLVLTLGAAASWGQVPADNDTSDLTGNTGGGTGALGNVTTGSNNTAYGGSALGLNTTGDFNTAVGFGVLDKNTAGEGNTAVGFNALLSNTAGGNNTAGGTRALLSNTTGSGNTAVGLDVLGKNTTGDDNIAVGDTALFNNTTGDGNIAIGSAALDENTLGGDNIAIGLAALGNNPAGDGNIAIGRHAGRRLTSGSQNIYLGHPGPGGGDHTESQTLRLGRTQTRTFIAGITNSPLTGSPVVITPTGRLGIVVSSARYKRDIQDMAARSQGLYQLRPVTFRYKHDAQGQPQYGLIAEEVAQVYPELVTKGADGKVESVQYHELIPMLLNEVQHQQQKLKAQAQQLSAQSQQLTMQGQQLAELKTQNARLQAALVQRDAEQRAQTAALAARLEQLEHAPHGATVAAR